MTASGGNPEVRQLLSKSRLVLFLSSACFVAACSGADLPARSEWKRATSGDGRVTLNFPHPPKVTKETAHTKIGDIEVEMMMDDGPAGTFGETHLTYPIPPERFDVDRGLEGAAQGAMRKSNGTVGSDERISLGSFPGRELLFRAQDDWFVRMRIYVDPNGPSVFTVQAVGSRELVDGPNAKAFLDSFVVNDPMPAAEDVAPQTQQRPPG